MQFSDDFPMKMEVEIIPDTGMPRPNCPAVSVAFGLYPVLDGEKTKEAGRQVYKDVEFIKVAVPGDRNSLFFQPSEQRHRDQFPQAYAAYKNRAHVPVVGTPIEQWAPISRSIALNLRALNIDTVEALAGVHDGHVDKIGSNGRDLRGRAKAWLAEAETGAEAQKLASEKNALNDQIASLQAQISALRTVQGNPAIPPIPVAPLPDPTMTIEQDVITAARRGRRASA